MSRAPLALLLACSLLAAATAAATPAQRPPPRAQRQHPTGDRSRTLTNVRGLAGGQVRSGRGRGGGEGSDFRSILSAATLPQVQLLGPQYLTMVSILDRLAELVGTEPVLSLFTTVLGASSGGFDNPASVGTADSSEEVQDLIV